MWFQNNYTCSQVTFLTWCSSHGFQSSAEICSSRPAPAQLIKYSREYTPSARTAFHNQVKRCWTTIWWYSGLVICRKIIRVEATKDLSPVVEELHPVIQWINCCQWDKYVLLKTVEYVNYWMVLSAEEIAIHWTLTPKNLLCYSLDSAAYM